MIQNFSSISPIIDSQINVEFVEKMVVVLSRLNDLLVVLWVQKKFFAAPPLLLILR